MTIRTARVRVASAVIVFLAIAVVTPITVSREVVYAQQQNSAGPATGERTFDGMVTCSHCGAKHSAAMSQTADKCVRICVHGGSQFALVQDDATYLLNGDLDILKKLAGQRAHIVGVLQGRIIVVSSAVAQS